ncbi:L-arabinonolactonase [Duganella sp. CF458]|uniref:SMP-30/gluconolactonase/LRE family protein n=1 Tax=Duganella sp. CF458 TaxID=1884368 RepID=UPI0008F2BC1D|nr:SMP-30/gluconolactonase/LRE family protein [Duganella sp. CF458]SFG87810.1 L-arabinonolactonase [Duganella sp. CF458]
MEQQVQPETMLPGAQMGALLWHDGCWWWSDTAAPALKAWRGKGLPESSRLPEHLAAFAVCRSGKLLLGLDKWLYLAERTPPGALKLARRLPLAIAAVDPAEARTRISDGCADRHGNFVLGTANLSPGSPPIGSFYQFSQRFGLRRLALPTVAAAHGIGFSADGGTLYFASSDGRELLETTYDPGRAEVGRIKRFAGFGNARIGGLTADAGGNLWIALREEGRRGRLAQFAAGGSLVRDLPLSAVQPSRPAFGGAHLEQLAAGALDGGLHTMEIPGVQGLAPALFDDAAD